MRIQVSSILAVLFFSPSGKRHNSTNSNFQKMAKINIFGTPKKKTLIWYQNEPSLFVFP